MVKDNDNLLYSTLLLLPLFFLIFPLFNYDYTYVDEIIVGRRQLAVYLHKTALPDPVEIDKYCTLMPQQSLGN